jgi:multimeric flavodoxin WrbA
VKVFAINGSPKKEGNTFYALNLVGDELKKEGIDFEVGHIGNGKIQGCTSCFNCVMTKSGKCIINDDITNSFLEKMTVADGIILGSPTYFSGITGSMKSFLDRAFFVASSGTKGDNPLRHKVGAAVVSVRRSGGIVTYQSLNNYLLYSEMFVSGSNYWNVIHGMMPGEAEKDSEGNQIMKVLGENTAYLLKMKAAVKDVAVPASKAKTLTNFVR